MDLWHSIGGMVALTLTSADPGGSLSALNDAGIPLYGVARGEDDLTVRFCVRRQDSYKLRRIVDKRGERQGKISGKGIYWAFVGLLRRPVLLAGMVLLLLLSIYLPTRVLFIQIEGNVTIPTNLILQKSSECGILFGASRREVRSEKVKNALLSAIPELQWAGINTSGCVATITVRERSTEDRTEDNIGVSSIVSLRDALVTECTVVKGSAACKVGQVVRAGQVLISGYTDCGSSIRAEQAKGEVYGETERALNAILPSEWGVKSTKTGQIIKYALIIGKKRINLYKGSGISHTTCDKMYVENYLTLPGGFQLPIGIVTEVWQQREIEETAIEEQFAEQLLTAYIRSYLSTQMIAGQIRKAEEAVILDSGAFCLTGKYACRELIGISRSEEILKPNGEHD